MLEQNQIAENCLMCGISISDIATEGVMCNGPIGQERLICKGCADGVVEQLRPKTSSVSWGIEERVGHLERMVNILDARHSIISSLQDDLIEFRAAIAQLQRDYGSMKANIEVLARTIAKLEISPQDVLGRGDTEILRPIRVSVASLLNRETQLSDKIVELERLLHKQNQEMLKVENTCLWRHSSSQKAQ